MIKPLSLLSISTIALLATTQAQAHVLCAPNNPQLLQQHSHNRVAHKVPRIQVSNHNQQKHLQAQRARQQKALANQRRITQQRRAQAQAQAQQVQARKNAIIQQQRLAAKRAQAARQKAALAAAQRAKVQHRTVVSKPVYHKPAPVQTVRRVAPTYVAPQQHVHHIIPAPTRVYVPSRAHVSVNISSGATRYHNHLANRAHRAHRNVINRANTVRHYQPTGHARMAYRYANKHGNRVVNRHNHRSAGYNNAHSGKNIYFGSYR